MAALAFSVSKMRFDQDNVGTTVDQPVDLLAIGQPQIVEAHRAIAGIVDVGRNRRSAVGRADGAGDKTALAVFAFGTDCRPAGNCRPLLVQIVDRTFHLIVGLRDAGRRERIRLQNICTGLGVAIVDLLDGIGLSKNEKVVVALLMTGAANEAITAEMILVKAEPLDLGAHGAIKHEDSLARRLPQGREHVATIAFRCFRSKKIVKHMRTPLA